MVGTGRKRNTVLDDNKIVGMGRTINEKSYTVKPVAHICRKRLFTGLFAFERKSASPTPNAAACVLFAFKVCEAIVLLS